MNSQHAVCNVYASGYSIIRGNNGYARTAERKCFDQAPSQDSANLFQLVDSSGNFITGQQNGLLLYNGGTLCDSSFNITAAHAVCKLMGFKNALSWKSGKIWRTQERYKVFSHSLVCSLRDWSSCTFRNDGKACTDHAKDVFLTCSGNRSPFTLVNSAGSQVSGLQQFLLLYNGGTVCGDQFSDNSADAICRDMGYYGAKRWRMEETNWSSGNPKVDYHIALDDVNCTEGDWKACSYTTSHDCEHGKVIYLSCMFIPVHNNNTSSLETCENTSTENTSTAFVTIICIGLVFIVFRKNSQIDRLSKKSANTDALVKKLQDQLKELQNRDLIDLKSVLTDCSDDNDQNIKLVDSSGNYITEEQQGLLLYNGGTLCDSSFNMTDADAVCRLMGFKGALSGKIGYIWKIQDNYKISSHGLACSVGDWSSCLSKSRNSCNDHTKDVFLTCSGTRSPFTLVNYSGSQVSGDQQFLVLYNGGTVCGDQFSHNSAQAICKDMGYYGAKTWRRGNSSWSTGSAKVEYRIALDDVNCSRQNWKSCSYSTSHDCKHGQVIYLSCMLKPNYSPVAVAADDGQNCITPYLTLICIGLAVINWRKGSKIYAINKKNAENNAKTEALVKNLQDQLEELRNVRKTSSKTNMVDSSGDEYQNSNGNLVLYDENKKSVWSSGTRGNYDEIELVVQDDNNVVLYNSFHRDRPVLWSTYTKDRYCPEDEIGKKQLQLIDDLGKPVISGQRGLLLFQNMTFCEINFNDLNNAAHAICKLMGFKVSGHQQFLLLYNGGTVCGDQFSDNSAAAICRNMGYSGAESWRLSWPFEKYVDVYVCKVEEFEN
ncbi:scavenger receptor cysteine-rich type 1 protein M130-like [Bolinopsis microptera]|uniref:scavenger receptor cysteine-rich type 1 protein M130-like n=1 Tax=Bolinopsis microptera TaxID=2820187 RepID=UPI00307904D6